MSAVSLAASSLASMTYDRVGGFDLQFESLLGDEVGEEIGKVVGVEIVEDDGDADADASGDGSGDCGGSSKIAEVEATTGGRQPVPARVRAAAPTRPEPPA